jgi:hypothetical protein
MSVIACMYRHEVREKGETYSDIVVRRLIEEHNERSKEK